MTHPPTATPRLDAGLCRQRLARGLAVAVGAVLLLLGGAAPVARAATPTPDAAAGPEVLLFDSNRTGNFEIYQMGTDGGDVRQLTNDPAWDSWWPVGSPDGTRILFYRNAKGSKHPDYTSNSLWMMNADGSDVHQLLDAHADGWGIQGHAVWSPDGSKLVMFGGPLPAPQVQVLDLNGVTAAGAPVTRSGAAPRGVAVLDPEWGAPGLVYISCPDSPCTQAKYEVYRSAPDGSSPQRLTDDDKTDNDPAWSPDGSQIAWLRKTGTTSQPPIPNAPIFGIYLMNADGSGQHPVIDDGNINSKPAWSPDGTTIYFHRLVYGGDEKGFQIWKIAPDGSGLTELTTGQPGSNEFPVVFRPAGPSAGASPSASTASTPPPTSEVPSTAPAKKKNPLGGLVLLVILVLVIVVIWRAVRRRRRGTRTQIG